MVSGWTRGGERVFDLARHHFIDGLTGGANGAHGRFPCSRRHGCVGVDPNQTFIGAGIADIGGVVERMRQRDLIERAPGCDVTVQAHERLGLQRPVDGANAVRSFRVPGRCRMVQIGRVRQVERLVHAGPPDLVVGRRLLFLQVRAARCASYARNDSVIAALAGSTFAKDQGCAATVFLANQSPENAERVFSCKFACRLSK